MQVNIGEKIRTLRKRDGRTQEALAEALGVTSQAVSRWETNGGMPDMQLLPAIANYFHSTIDELFGYDSDRAQRLQGILTEADRAINAQGPMRPCVSLLRDALAEFPSEPQILLRLGYALTQLGWQAYGARGMTADGSDYAQNDVAYNAQNPYWQEATGLFEKALAMGIDQSDREAAVTVAVQLYASMGAYEKAEVMARRQDSVVICRECLLSAAAEGETRDRYQGEALIALARQLKTVMETAVMTKLSLVNFGAGVEKLLGVARLLELIFDDGRCGICHADLRDLYLACAVFAARQNRAEDAAAYFDKSYLHNLEYEAVLGKGAYAYTAPLVAKVTFLSGNEPAVPETFWAGWASLFPENLRKIVLDNPRYSDLWPVL